MYFIYAAFATCRMFSNFQSETLQVEYFRGVSLRECHQFGPDFHECNQFETNIAPENSPSQEETSIPTIHF